MILAPRKYKAIAVASWLGYWLLYAFSGGMFFYYPTDITPILRASQTPNPYFLNYYNSFSGSYTSGMIWYPNGHLQVNLLVGPFIYSVVLCTLFSLNIALFLFSVRVSRFRSAMAPAGILALIPALFRGGCCSVPLGLALIGTILPTAGLIALVYGYPFWINLAFVTLLSVSCVSVGRRLARIMPPPVRVDAR